MIDLTSSVAQCRRERRIRDLRKPKTHWRWVYINLKLWGTRNFNYETRLHELNSVKKRLYSDAVMQNYAEINSVKHMGINHERIAGIDPIHRRSYLDFKLRLSDHLLGDHGDRMTLANSVEGRYPFLDPAVVEFVVNMPPGLKLNQMNEKYVVKKVAEKFVPPQIIRREKFGFTAPGSAFLLKKNHEYINDMMSFSRMSSQGYFNPNEIEKLKTQYQQPDFRINVPHENDLLMTVLTFNIFLEVFGLT